MIVLASVAMTIARMAAASGKSQSRIVAEFLTEAEPAFRRIAGMLEVAKQQQTMFPKSTVAELQTALDLMSGNVVDVLDRVENAMQLPLEEPAKGKRAAKPSPGKGRSAARRRRR